MGTGWGTIVVNTRSNFSASGAKAADAVREPLNELVARMRAGGAKAADAVADAAGVLGLSARTARALHWGETCAGRDLDVTAARARFAAWLGAEAERLEQQAAALRRRQTDMERADASLARVLADLAPAGAARADARALARA